MNNPISRLLRYASSLVLVLALVALFYRLLLGEVIFWGTPLLQFYPWEKMAFDAVRAGQLPLWNPLAGHGAPLLANYQTAVFYPPNWLYLIIPTEIVMGLIGLLHVVWAGLGMSTYLRRLGIGRLGQGVGMLAFALSGYLISRFGFLSITATVPWLPWLMWAVDGLLSPGAADGSQRKKIVQLALIVAMQLLAGHAQTTFYSLLLAGCYAVWRLLTSEKRLSRSSLSRLALPAGALALGIALAAVQLIPTAELMLASQRASGVERAAGLTYSFWPWSLLRLLAPNLFGSPAAGNYDGYGAYWEDATYVGLLPLVMAGHGVARWLREWRASALSAPAGVAPFFLISLPVALFFALGRSNPAFVWLFEHNLPGIVTFQGPARWMLIAVFGLCVLAAVGIDVWHTSERGLFWTRLLTASGLSFFVASAAAERFAGSAVRSNFVPAMAWLGAIIILVGLVSLLLPQVEAHPRWRPLWEIGVFSALAFDLVAANWGLNPTIPAAYYHQPSMLADIARTDDQGYRTLYLPDDEQAAKFGDKQPQTPGFLSFHDFQAGDRAHWDEARSSLLPNLGMIDSVPSANNFEPLLVGAHAALLGQLGATLDDQTIAMIQKMNVGLLLSTTGCGNLQVVGQSGRITACRVPDAWPRAALAQCQIEPDQTVRCDHVLQEAELTVDQPLRVVVKVSAARPATLLLLDTYYPGWEAAINGTPVTIHRANVAFRAVDVPAGQHEVVFSYHPASLSSGAAISFLALMVTAGLWLTASQRRASEEL